MPAGANRQTREQPFARLPDCRGEQSDITRWFKALIEEDGPNAPDIRIAAGRPGRVLEITLDELVRCVFDSPSPQLSGKRGIG